MCVLWFCLIQEGPQLWGLFCAQMLKFKFFLENTCVTKKVAYISAMNNKQNQKTNDMNKQNPLEKMDLSFLQTLTENSANIARCIAAIQSFECGMGASMQQLERMTGLEGKVIRGNISDLVKKGYVTVNDMVESCYLYELKDFPR